VSKSESSDTHFFNSFSVVLGILIAFTIILFAFARMVGRNVQGQEVLQDPLRFKSVAENTAPFGREAVAGQDNSALTVATTTGEQAFKQVCSACHGTGLNGAPKIGDKAAWGPRIAQGKDTLYTHAISGKGLMPPKGGTTWPDATIRMTVDYMVSQAK
jgi:cytochrome c5